MDDFDKFYNKALRFLSLRQRSEKEIRDYLTKKKSNDITTEKIIANLKEQKFIDDEEFTRWWIEQRSLLKPKASRTIKFELKQKGIQKEIIDKAFENDLVTDLEKAKKLAEKRMPRYSKIMDRKKVYEKLGRFLASKGFDYDIIKEVIDQVLPKEYNK